MRLWDGSGISWTICRQSAPCSRQITTPNTPSLNYYRPDALPMPNRVRALKAHIWKKIKIKCCKNHLFLIFMFHVRNADGIVCCAGTGIHWRTSCHWRSHRRPWSVSTSRSTCRSSSSSRARDLRPLRTRRRSRRRKTRAARRWRRRFWARRRDRRRRMQRRGRTRRWMWSVNECVCVPRLWSTYNGHLIYRTSYKCSIN